MDLAVNWAVFFFLGMNKHYLEQLNDLKRQGLKRELFNKSAFQGLNLSSNDYLGLSSHPRVKQAAKEALENYGTGAGASRLLAGTLQMHRDLERALALFLDKEAALVFSSGYHVNTGLLSVLLDPGDVIFMDRLCHASILDGIKLSGVRFFTFEHNDADDLTALLKAKRNSYHNAMVITEGVFSMDGDFPPLAEIIKAARQYSALVYLDEAHSLGVFGSDGRGVAAQYALLKDVDVFVGTLSKTLGSQGGFVAARQVLIDLFVSRCRSFLYTTALAPAMAAAAHEALRLLPACEDRRSEILKAARHIRTSLEEMGYDPMKSGSQIIPVWTGDLMSTQRLSEHLFQHGFFVPSIRPPTVPVGHGRVRLSITHDVVLNGVDKLLKSFKEFSLVKTH